MCGGGECVMVDFCVNACDGGGECVMVVMVDCCVNACVMVVVDMVVDVLNVCPIGLFEKFAGTP